MHVVLVDCKGAKKLIYVKNVMKTVCSLNHNMALAVRMTCLYHSHIFSGFFVCLFLFFFFLQYLHKDIHSVIFFLIFFLWTLTQEQEWNLNAQYTCTSVLKFLHL